MFWSAVAVIYGLGFAGTLLMCVAGVALELTFNSRFDKWDAVKLMALGVGLSLIWPIAWLFD